MNATPDTLLLVAFALALAVGSVVLCVAFWRKLPESVRVNLAFLAVFLAVALALVLVALALMALFRLI